MPGDIGSLQCTEVFGQRGVLDRDAEFGCITVDEFQQRVHVFELQRGIEELLVTPLHAGTQRKTLEFLCRAQPRQNPAQPSSPPSGALLAPWQNLQPAPQGHPCTHLPSFLPSVLSYFLPSFLPLYFFHFKILLVLNHTVHYISRACFLYNWKSAPSTTLPRASSLTPQLQRLQNLSLHLCLTTLVSH